MALDFLLAVLTLAFAVWGAFSGPLRQGMNLLALAFGYLAALPAGRALGPWTARLMDLRTYLGPVVATMACFVLVTASVRLGAIPLLRWWERRRQRARHTSPRGRAAGFLMGGLRVPFAAFILLACASLAEYESVLWGRTVGLHPEGSASFMLARKLRPFDATDAVAADLYRVARASLTSAGRARLENDPSFQELQKNPKFQKAMSEEEFQRAVESGDMGALMRSHVTQQLVKDPGAAARLKAAAGVSE